MFNQRKERLYSPDGNGILERQLTLFLVDGLKKQNFYSTTDD